MCVCTYVHECVHMLMEKTDKSELREGRVYFDSQLEDSVLHGRSVKLTGAGRSWSHCSPGWFWNLSSWQSALTITVYNPTSGCFPSKQNAIMRTVWRSAHREGFPYHCPSRLSQEEMYCFSCPFLGCACIVRRTTCKWGPLPDPINHRTYLQETRSIFLGTEWIVTRVEIIAAMFWIGMAPIGSYIKCLVIG